MLNTISKTMVGAAGSGMGAMAGAIMNRAGSTEGGTAPGSTNALGDLRSLYEPAMGKLKEQRDSTDLVDHAEATADNRFNRGQEAANHMLAATGGGTTRQQALEKYNSQLAGGANRDASVNAARSSQRDIREEATDQLGGMQRSMAKQEVAQMRHGENLTQQREMHNEKLKAENKASKRAFWGNVAGGALGIGAAAVTL